MVVAFSNFFGRHYEGAANWLEASVLSLLSLPDPPVCVIVDGDRASLPTTLASSQHVRVARGPDDSKVRGGRWRSARRRLLQADWEDPSLSAIAEDHGVDVWVSFGPFHGLARRRPLAMLFPDFQFRHLPTMFDESDREVRSRVWDWIAARADAVLVLSRVVADDALAFTPDLADRLHICPFPPPITAARLARSPQEVVREYNLPGSFLLVCNQFYRHKNHEIVIRTLGLLAARGHERPTLAFTGRPSDPRDPDFFSQLLTQVNRAGIHPLCRFLGVIPREDQLALIQAADAIVQPSLFEGRGAIVEEAAILGRPLLCSDIPIHREIAPPRASYFDPQDPEALAELLTRRFSTPRRPRDEILEHCASLTRSRGAVLQRACQAAIAHSGARTRVPRGKALTSSHNG